jgi:hypothetical protein
MPPIQTCPPVAVRHTRAPIAAGSEGTAASSGLLVPTPAGTAPLRTPPPGSRTDTRSCGWVPFSAPPQKRTRPVPAGTVSPGTQSVCPVASSATGQCEPTLLVPVRYSRGAST